MVQTRAGPTELRETFLPTPELVDICTSLGLEDTFSFLELDLELGPDVARDWKFLSEHFAVGSQANLSFHLETLTTFIAYGNVQHRASMKALGRMYEAIEQCVTSADAEIVRYVPKT